VCEWLLFFSWTAFFCVGWTASQLAVTGKGSLRALKRRGNPRFCGFVSAGMPLLFSWTATCFALHA